MMFPENKITQLLTLVRRAGDELIRIYRRDDQLNVELKSDDSPVTIADLRSNQILVNGLRELDESIPIVSEENKSVSWAVRKNYDRFWIIDPLDGTKEFIKELDEFTIHLALVEENKVTLGIIYAPVTEELYYAWEGGGSWLSLNGHKRRLAGHAVDYTMKGLRIMRSRSNLDPLTMEYIDQFDEPELITMGSGLKFVQLITGEADYYPRARTHMKEWDIAPAQVILEEAGGGIYQWDVDKPLQYNKKDITVKGFRALSLIRDLPEL